jgi:hypothetical protein
MVGFLILMSVAPSRVAPLAHELVRPSRAGALQAAIMPIWKHPLARCILHSEQDIMGAATGRLRQRREKSACLLDH